MNRRQFLGQSTAAAVGLAAFGSGCATFLPRIDRPQVMTVLGPIPPERMGTTLPHEHVLVDFIGAAQTSRARYSAQEAFDVALPHLLRVKDLGCSTLVECTPAYLGRDPALLKRLAVASGLQIITNTGYYGAAGNRFLPAHARSETTEQLAYRWVREWREGIEGTGIRPGFIKIGVDAGRLSDLHRKLVRAAAFTHLATGLTIAAHTGDGVAALEELALLKEEGVAGEAFIWVHAQSEPKPELHAQAAASGAWVEFDGLSPESVNAHVKLLQTMKRQGFLQRVLLSHDAGWYHVGEPRGGDFRPFDTLFSQGRATLREASFTEEEVRQTVALNPAAAFAIRLRRS
jgi:phosphotriesterase-related protein